MVFHIGVLWRLYEAGLLAEPEADLERLRRLHHRRACWGSNGASSASIRRGSTTDFVPEVVTPLRRLAGETIDAEAVIIGGLFPGSISDRVAAAYDEHLFARRDPAGSAGRAALRDQCDQRPVGRAVAVHEAYMRDWRVGEVKAPSVPLARAVAASSAFPPVLSPVRAAARRRRLHAQLRARPATAALHHPRSFLTDGGVYDNLGLETAWKRYQTILVSDAGGKLAPEEEPKSDWARHAYRVLDLIDNQVRSLRKRQVIDSFEAGTREGAYWGIRTDIADYGLADPLPCPHRQDDGAGGDPHPPQAHGRRSCRSG